MLGKEEGHEACCRCISRISTTFVVVKFYRLMDDVEKARYKFVENQLKKVTETPNMKAGHFQATTKDKQLRVGSGTYRDDTGYVDVDAGIVTPELNA
ncbi:hypothetical protein LTR42_011587 [Elasticomyces elasticus]|nr:hypothetical protein LTR42_011587 [Elasticomyces elasticus]